MEVTSCCACLVAEHKLYSVKENNLQQALEDLTDLPVDISTTPLHLCYLCRALVLKFAAFRAAYRSHRLQLSHLMLLREMGRGQIIDEQIIHQEHNVRKKTGLLLKISQILHIDIYKRDKKYSGMRKTGISKLEECEDIKKETKTKAVEKRVDRNLIRNDVKKTAQHELFNNIKANYNNEINIKRKCHRSENANSDIWELNTEDELGNVCNKKIKLTRKDDDQHVKVNETRETGTNKNDKEKGNKKNTKLPIKDVKRQNKNNKTETQTALRNIVFTEPDKYSSKVSKKTLKDYEEFAKRFKMKVDFFVTKEEQMDAFLARKETDSYKKATFKCELCYIGFSTSSAHTNHMTKHEKHNSRPFECEFCHRYFNNNRTRRQHVEGHRVKYTCLQCGETLTIKCCLDRHFKVHAGMTYECKTCFKTFRIKSVYYKHIRTHGSTNGSSASLVSCSFCDDAFNGPVGLKVHMQWLHPEAMDSFCASCGRQFSTEAARTTHEDSCSPDNSPCVRCGASFPTDERLAEHVAETHTQTFTCPECKKQFRNKVSLRSHRYYDCLAEQSHTQAKNLLGPKLCELCGKTLTNIYVLRDHMRLHTGEKPYKCNECGKTFRILTLLQIHMVTHTDERRFKCSLCPKAFRQTSHLRTHMFSHTKERPYACKTCPKRYTGQTALKEHVDTAHRGLPPRQRAKKQEL